MKNKLWWAYVPVLLILGFGRMIERIAKDSGGFWSQFGPSIGATLVCVGIVFWLNNTAVLNVWFWRTFHAIIGLIIIASLAFSIYLAIISAYAPAGIVLMITTVLTPGFFGLFYYSYRSPNLWTGTER